jgi:FAD:protein FMN transferase
MRRVFIPQTACAVAPPDIGEVRRLFGETMGTTWSVALVAPDALDLADAEHAIVATFDRVIAQMSTWRDDSDLCRFNRMPPGAWCDLPEDLVVVLDQALLVARASDGAFDPTVGPVVDVWGFGPVRTPPRLPSHAALAVAKARVGWRRIELDAPRRRARHEGVAIDLSAIAKGYAVDEAVASLARLGVASCLVEVGGELCGVGAKPDGQPWWVAIERPPRDPSERTLDAGEPPVETIVALHALSVASSGDYRRGFDIEGRRYSHTIDPRTGAPVTHGVASVSVLHRSCMAADAWSTALTVMGRDEGMRLALERDLAALFVTRTAAGLMEHMTPALASMLDG